jgi:hypothetical protein
MPPAIDRTVDNEFGALVVRTEYSDDSAWLAVVDLLEQPCGDDSEVEASNQFVDDPAFDGASPDEVLSAVTGDSLLSVVFLADAATIRGDHPLLTVSTMPRQDFMDDEDYEDALEFGRQFRLLPAAVADVHTNLALANMDFSEFARSAANDPEHIHRGFLGAENNTPEPTTSWDGWSRPCDGRRLRRGETLRDAALTSPNGRYELVCSGGGCALREDGAGVWVPGPGRPTGTGLHLDANGELQYRSTDREAWPIIPDFDHMKGRRKRWPTDVKDRPGPGGAQAIIVRDDGDIDLVDVDDRTMWSFDTARHVRLLHELRAMSIERVRDSSAGKP